MNKPRSSHPWRQYGATTKQVKHAERRDLKRKQDEQRAK